MNVKDVFPKQDALWVRLHEKGGKRHQIPCQHNQKDWLRACIEAVRIGEDGNGPLFRTVDRKTKTLSSTRIERLAPGRWSSAGHLQSYRSGDRHHGVS